MLTIESIAPSARPNASVAPDPRPAPAGAVATDRASRARRRWLRWSTWFVSVDDMPTAQALSDQWSSVPHR